MIKAEVVSLSISIFFAIMVVMVYMMMTIGMLKLLKWIILPHLLLSKGVHVENGYWWYFSLAFYLSKGCMLRDEAFILYFITDVFVIVGYCFGFARHTWSRQSDYILFIFSTWTYNIVLSSKEHIYSILLLHCKHCSMNNAIMSWFSSGWK